MHLTKGKEKPVLHHHVSACRTYVHQLRLPWNVYQRQNLVLLAGAFLVRRSLPLRRLARALAGPTRSQRAADKRLRRFLGNPRLDTQARDRALCSYLWFLLPRFGAVPAVPVMVDWLFVDERAVLWAQIPYQGRSFPLLASVHSRQLEDDAPGRTQAERALLGRLRRCWPSWTPEPLLLMDRGFDKGPLLRWLLEEGFRFIVRIQRGHYLYAADGAWLNDAYDAQGQLVRQGPLHPEVGQSLRFPHVTYLKEERLPLHLVVSAALDLKTGNVSEWRLVTNLPEAQLVRVPKLYAARMQPEGTHLDVKRGHFVSGFALSHLSRMRPDRLERLLFMLGLVYGFLVLVAETQRDTRAWLCQRHWGLSLSTFALDLLHNAGSAARRIARQACASDKLHPLWL
jgi:hypothetical protein